MAHEDNDTDALRARGFRSRKADLLQMGGVGVLIVVANYVWSGARNLQNFAENQNRVARQYAEEVKRDAAEAVKEEKDRAQTREAELQADIRELRVTIGNLQWRRK